MDYDSFFSYLEDIFSLGQDDRERMQLLKQKYKEEEIFNLEVAYETLIRILKDWMDLEDRYYHIVALWILGTYFMDDFETYPYLFINATKRSGKSRLLKILAKLCRGIHTTSMTEAVLFRLPMMKSVGLFIDEAERIGSKGKEALRELLNSAYKRGVKIYRARKSAKSEAYVLDEFEVFVPISLANISGLDDVLEDRCITLVLERSFNPLIINKPEIFTLDEKIWFFLTCMEKVVTLVTINQEEYESISRALVKPSSIDTTLELDISNINPSLISLISKEFHDNNHNIEIIKNKYGINNLIKFLEKIKE